MQIPNPAVHTRIGGKRTKWSQPIKRNQLLPQVVVAGRRLIVAGIFSNELAASIENFESDRQGLVLRQIEIDDRAVGRVRRGWRSEERRVGKECRSRWS